MVIWKYEIPVAGEFSLEIPISYQFLHVDTQRGVPMLWVMVDPEAPKRPINFFVAATGQSLPVGVGLMGVHVGTFQVENETLVFHLFKE